MAQLQSLADAPNTLREYETIYILRPDTINDKVAEVNGRVKAIIEERGGKIINVDNWGKRKLAYEINKERKGIYLFWQYLGSAEIVSEFERNMRMLDPVMRYLTIKLDKNVSSGTRDSEVNEETFEKAATTAADEEELIMRRGPDAYDNHNPDDDDDEDDYVRPDDNFKARSVKAEASDESDSDDADSDDNADSDDDDADSDDDDSEKED